MGTHLTEERIHELEEALRRVCAGEEAQIEIPDEDDILHGISVMLRFLLDDVERARAAEQELEREREDLDLMRQDFVNIFSHEVGTPLTPICLQLDVLRRAKSLDEVQRALGILDRNVRLLVRFVHDMSAVSKVDRGMLSVRMEELDLGQLVLQAVSDFQSVAKAQGVNLDVAVDHLNVAIDHSRMLEVVQNLLSNAIRWTPEGTVDVRLRQRGSTAILSIRDQGPGLTSDEIARLFRPFSRLHAEPSGVRRIHNGGYVEGGLGVGLYICKGIVQSHGGQIWCDSRGPGFGATFIVKLPLA